MFTETASVFSPDLATRSEFFQPAEWVPHRSCWLAWPSQRELWGEYFEAAQEEFVNLCRAIADVDPVSGQHRGDLLEILVPDAEHRKSAHSRLNGLPVRIYEVPYGDIWLRDTGPIFVMSPTGNIACSEFKFNGWGGKYLYDADLQVAGHIAAQSGVKSFLFPWILEGGSVDVDGDGTCLTTRQCLLNPNRNPEMSQGQLENALSQALGVKKVLWLDRGLVNDHTDGHIDNVARFIAPGVVVCMESLGVNRDPNHESLEGISADLESFLDVQGRKLRVVRVPSPGTVQNEEGAILPASYMNFYLSNSTVVIPTYGSDSDDQAVTRIGSLFPGRRAIGLSARAILAGGGGAFHCITQQQPAGVLL